MKTLTRYIGREVLASILLIFSALVMLFAFFDLIHELGDVGRGGYTITAALLFVALQLPARMYELFPVATLIGTLFGLAQLVSSSEYTVMRASGASLLQVGWALIRIGIPLALVTFLAGEFVAPQAAFLSQKVRAQARGDTTARRRPAVPVRILVQAGPDLRQHPQRACRSHAGRRADLRVRQRPAPEDRAQRRVRNASPATASGG